MADKSVAILQCGLASGLVLEVGRPTPTDPFAHEAVTLAFGENRIDGQFWLDWLDANPNYTPLRTGQLGGRIET